MTIVLYNPEDKDLRCWAEQQFEANSKQAVLLDRERAHCLAVHKERMIAYHPNLANDIDRLVSDLDFLKENVAFQILRLGAVHVPLEFKQAQSPDLRAAKLEICQACDQYNDDLDETKWTCDKLTGKKSCCGGRTLPKEKVFADMLNAGSCPIGKHKRIAVQWHLDVAPKARGLGDMVMCAAIIDRLHRLTKKPVLVPDRGYWRELYAADERVSLFPAHFKVPMGVRQYRFSLIPKTGKHVIVTSMETAGLYDPSVDITPRLVVKENEIADARDKIGRGYCVFSVGGLHTPDQRIVPVAAWERLFDSTPDTLWVCPAHLQKYLVERPNVRYMGIGMSVRQMMAAAAGARVCVTVDSALAHIARAVGTTTIVLHTGFSDPKNFIYPGQVVLGPDEYPACSPCYWNPSCGGEYHCCKIRPDKIVTAVRAALSEVSHGVA